MPDNQGLHLNPNDMMLFGKELFHAGRMDEAYNAFSTVADNDPQNWDAAFQAGFILSATNKYKEALHWYNRAGAIAITELNLVALNRSQVLGEMGRSEEAISMLDGLIARQSHHAHAYYNRGVLKMQVDKFEEAFLDFEQSLVLDPTCAQGDARFCRGFANLVLGNYIDGFRDFEHRLKDNIYAKAGPEQGDELRPEHVHSYPDSVNPEDRHPDILGQRVLVLSVMGRGDVIQFGRFLSLLVDRGAEVLVTADRGTEELFRPLHGVTVVDEKDPLPPADYWCHMMGLAHVFQITTDTVPPPLKIAYMPNLLRAWRAIIPDDGIMNVGLCWAGSPTSRYDEHRSIPLADMAPLTEVRLFTPFYGRKVRFFGLQQEIRESDKYAYKNLDITHIGERFTDFRQTAHAMKCLDLVITVDTSVAHLAGTVGVPTWILTTLFRTYWLWIKGRTDTPWYPSVELIRQPIHGSWPSAIVVARDRLLGKLLHR